MGVQVVTAWQIHPGRTAELLHLAKEAARIHESVGSSASLILWAAAGANSGNANYILNFADLDAWAATADSLLTHAEWQEWWAKNYKPNGPGVIGGQAILADLPGFESAPLEPGDFVQAWTGRLAPGHTLAEMTKTLEATREHSLKHGALWMNARRCIVGGDFVGSVVVTAGFRNASHYAQAATAYNADPSTAEARQQIATGLVNQSISHGRVVPL